jgi:hypothetical protein
MKRGRRTILACVLVYALAPSTYAGGDVEVRVVGPTGRGLPQLPLLVETAGGERVRVVVTDFDGTASLRDVVRDGSLRVGVHPEVGGSWRPAHAVIDRTKIVLRGDAGLPARLEPVDAHTGKPVRGAEWKSRFASMHEDLASAPADGPHTALVVPGRDADVRFRVTRAPDGYVAADAGRCKFHASRFAASLVARYPLRPEAHVRLKAAGDEPPARVAYGVCVGPVIRPIRVGALVDGAVRLRGVPFHPGDPLSVIVTTRDVAQWEKSRTFVSPRGGEKKWFEGLCYEIRDVAGAVVLTADLPEDPRTVLTLGYEPPAQDAPAVPWPFAILSGSAGGRRGGLAPPRAYEPGNGRDLHVRVLRRNGQPAAGAKVVLRYGVQVSENAARVERAFVHADTNGVARFRGVPDERVSLLLAEPGMVRTPLRDVAVRADPPVVLREGDGGALAVRVVDEQGRPRPFARIRAETFDNDHVRGPIDCWTDEAETVQRVDPFTDETGRRVFLHVTPGKVRVAAWWLDRAGHAVVTVREGETAEAVVTVRATKR